MRLFIGIMLDEVITDSLAELQKDMKRLGVSGNYTKIENLHLTLVFIGEYGSPDDVLDAMEEARFTPFSIRLDGVGNFGELFWVGLSKNEELQAFVKRLRRTLSDHGIPFDRKRFSPHITLIRKASYREGQEIPVRVPPAGEMEVRRISLIRSERGRNGMVYTETGCIS